MRLSSILTAILVAAGLYMMIMQRDLVMAFAGSNDSETATETADDTTQARVISNGESTASAVAIVAMRSVAKPVDNGIVLRGRTEAARHIDVRAETSGLVISEPLRRGTFVEKGQVLCELDPGTRNAELVEARARLAEADANNTAAVSLVQKGFTSETTAISRKASLETAMAGVERAEKELARLTIEAPFRGLLESDAAELGALLQPGAACATIIDLDPIKLVGFVPERDIPRLQLGAVAGARLLTGETLRGQLTFISRSADPQTRTFRVEVEVSNPDFTIRDGSTAEILIGLAGSTAHLLPQSVLTLDDDGRLGVRAAVDNMARFMPVSIVRDTADGVLVADLPDELDVIIVGQEYVRDGRPITVTMQEAPE